MDDFNDQYDEVQIGEYDDESTLQSYPQYLYDAQSTISQSTPYQPTQPVNNISQPTNTNTTPSNTSSNYTPLSEQEIITAINLLKSTLRINTEEEIIQLAISTIQRITKLNSHQIDELLAHVSIPLCSNIATCTALAMLQDNSLRTKLSFGDPIIDNCLDGGILPRAITEIAGEAGSGKTQLCLQLCLQVQLPIERGGLDGGTCYISTENELPTKRLVQLMEAFKHRYNLPEDVNLSSQIYTEAVPTIDKLTDTLGNKLPQLLQKYKVRLVIIDSIAALFRFEYSEKEAVERSKMLWKLAEQLKLLADGFNIPIVVVNQVSDVFSSEKYSSSTTPKVVPALGLSWSNCINMRIMVNRTKAKIAANIAQEPLKKKAKVENGPIDNTIKEDMVVVRKMSVVFAPHLPNSSCKYVVEKEGIRGIV